MNGDTVKPLLGAAVAVLIAAGCLRLMRRWRVRSAPLPRTEVHENDNLTTLVQLTPEQAIEAIPDDSSWQAIALRTRVQGCGGTIFANSRRTRMCHAASGGRLAFARLPSKESLGTDDIAVCAAAVSAEAAAGRGGASFWYLETALIAPLREAIGPLARLGEGNPMGMYVLEDSTLSPAEPPPLPAGCTLRRLEDTDAPRVNRDSGMGPNRMTRAAIGCWGVDDAEGELVGWAVRGADGAIGMLHVYAPHRNRGIATAILRAICDELRAMRLPCVAYVRDDNGASRAVFGHLGFERVGDVRWCMVRLAPQRL